jgi:hypothetical protein
MIRNTIVGVALGAVVIYGVLQATGTMKGQAAAPNITANNNMIINIGAGEVKMTPEAFHAVVAAGIGDKKENARNAVKFIAPTRQDPDASVQIQGQDTEPLKITPATIAEAPKKIDFPKNQKTEELKQVEVELRASDRDSKKSGWAGKINGITNRVKIELDPVVDEADMFGKVKVLANVTLVFGLKKGTKEYSPTRIFVRKIY